LNQDPDGEHDAEDGNSLSSSQIITKVTPHNRSKQRPDTQKRNDQPLPNDRKLPLSRRVDLSEPLQEIFHEEDIGDLAGIVTE